MNIGVLCMSFIALAGQAIRRADWSGISPCGSIQKSIIRSCLPGFDHTEQFVLRYFSAIELHRIFVGPTNSHVVNSGTAVIPRQHPSLSVRASFFFTPSSSLYACAFNFFPIFFYLVCLSLVPEVAVEKSKAFTQTVPNWRRVPGLKVWGDFTRFFFTCFIAPPWGLSSVIAMLCEFSLILLLLCFHRPGRAFDRFEWAMVTCVALYQPVAEHNASKWCFFPHKIRK